jgi:hypothetical protein
MNPTRGAYEASPSLEVPTDLDRPFPLLGIQADLVGVFFQRYALRGEVAAAPAPLLLVLAFVQPPLA